MAAEGRGGPTWSSPIGDQDLAKLVTLPRVTPREVRRELRSAMLSKHFRCVVAPETPPLQR
eukprot:7057274-Prymnesium_polylepis.1